MMLSMIAAMAKNRIIGKDNAMPWHLPADFAWFKRHTMNKSIIMGRKTFESIGKPLPKRRNIVLTSDFLWSYEGVEVAQSINEALSFVANEAEAMIIGGATIYQACLPLAQKLYLTFIDAQINGDARFPDWGKGWTTIQIEHHLADEKNAYNMKFVILER